MKNFLPKKKIENCNELVLKFIVDDYQAFNVVENKYFQQLCNTLDYSLPGRTFFTSMLKSDFLNKKYLFKKLVLNLSFRVGITLDLWTSSNSTPYLGIKLHYINEKFEPVRCTLAFQKFDYPHDSLSLKNGIKQTLEEYGLLKKIISITNDNASSMLKFYDLLYEDIKVDNNLCYGIGCGCHIINLAINDGLIPLEKLIKIYKNVTKTIKASPKIIQEIKLLCVANSKYLSF